MAGLEHAVYEAASGKYVGIDGLLGDDPEWQTDAAWANTLVWALTPSTEYRFQSKARSAGGTETALGEQTIVTTGIPGDANGDGVVNLADKLLVEAAFGSNPTRPNWDAHADLNGDGRVTTLDRRIVQLGLADQNQDGSVNLFDVLVFAEAWATSIGDANYAASADLNADEIVDLHDLLILADAWSSLR
jgi:hypothetical protein